MIVFELLQVHIISKSAVERTATDCAVQPNSLKLKYVMIKHDGQWWIKNSIDNIFDLHIQVVILNNDT